MNSKIMRNNKAFAISLDIFFAILLILGLTAYVGIGLLPSKETIQTGFFTQSKQVLDDAITAIDNNGYLGQVLVDETSTFGTAQAEEIYARLKEILPKNMASRVKITQYEQVDDLGNFTQSNSCRGSRDFDKCFKPNPIIREAGSAISSDREIFYGTQFFMKKQPYIRSAGESDCITSSQLKEQNKKNNNLLLQGSAITTKTSATDNSGAEFSASNKMQCYNPDDGIGPNEIAITKISEKTGAAVIIPNAQVFVNPVSGMDFCQCNNIDCTGECDALTGNWAASPIVFTANLNENFSSQYFKVRIPCNGAYCEKSIVEFPTIDAYPAGTYIKDSENIYKWGTDTICDCADCTVKCTKQIDFAFKDIGIKLISGLVNETEGTSTLNFEITNNSATEPITVGNFFVEFRQDSVTGSLIDPMIAPANCSINMGNLACIIGTIPASEKVSFSNAKVNSVGYIYAVISGVNECTKNNNDIIYCLPESKVFYYKIEYWAWIE